MSVQKKRKFIGDGVNEPDNQTSGIILNANISNKEII